MKRNDLGPLAVNRRDFLKFTGGGIAVALVLKDAEPLAEIAAQQRGYPSDPNAYVLIQEDGRVRIFSGKIEMGQGVETSQAQMAAEELRVRLDQVEMVLGDTALCPWDAGTWGSLTTRQFGPFLRAACARAREILLDLASQRLGVGVDRLRAEDGVIRSLDGRGQITYGELARGQRLEHVLDREAALRKVEEFTVMGTSAPRLDAVEKVTGAAKYAADIRLPGMLRARILRPPAHGATLRKLDTTAAKAIPGVLVVEEPDLVAVLHAERDTADRALSLVQAEWDVPSSTVDHTNIWDHLVAAAPTGRTGESAGSLDAGARASARFYEHTYRDPYLAHAPIEPHTSVAVREGDRITVWSSTQSPFGDQGRIARALGLPPEQVRVITPYVGGGFGGKAAGPQAVEAARLAWLTGHPVQVLWTREEEFFYDTFHAAAVVTIRSGVDRTGRIQLWDYHVYMAGTRGAEVLYDIPHKAVVNHTSNTAHFFGTGPWRAPGANSNTFARESQMDIMAADLGVDPLEFRLRHATEPRLRGVLQAVAEMVPWSPAPAPSGRGLGVACGYDAGTYVAHAAQVRVDRDTGQVRVERMWVAQDMGVVVNPEGAIMQMEGCVTMGLGYALMEEIRFRGGDIHDRNFDTYRIPRFEHLPEIHTRLVRNEALAPQGGGEPAIVAVGAVIANAIFDACGARLFAMPFTPERVRAALT